MWYKKKAYFTIHAYTDIHVFGTIVKGGMISIHNIQYMFIIIEVKTSKTFDTYPCAIKEGKLYPLICIGTSRFEFAKYTFTMIKSCGIKRKSGSMQVIKGIL